MKKAEIKGLLSEYTGFDSVIDKLTNTLHRRMLEERILGIKEGFFHITEAREVEHRIAELRKELNGEREEIENG